MTSKLFEEISLSSKQTHWYYSYNDNEEHEQVKTKTINNLNSFLLDKRPWNVDWSMEHYVYDVGMN